MAVDMMLFLLFEIPGPEIRVRCTATDAAAIKAAILQLTATRKPALI